MKLYATITSERATKGQGGKKLDISVRDEEKEIVNMKVLPRDNGTENLVIIAVHGNRFGTIPVPTGKGKKQKGEVLPRSRQFKNWPTNGA